MENALAIRDQQQQPATLAEYNAQTDLTVERATYWAKKLMEVVDSCGLAKSMGGKKYLEVEGWQMIAEFAHVKPIIEWVRPWKDAEDNLIGYEARCRLVNDGGEEIGAGESSCGLDAFPCRGKQGSEQDKAAKSAAQTWAISRALRNKFSFVAKIAGYQPVPAEEMSHDAPRGPAEHTKAPARPAAAPNAQRVTEPQRKRLWAICKAKGVSEQKLKDRLALYGFVSSFEVTRDKYEEICAWAEAGGYPSPPSSEPVPQGAPEYDQREPGDDDDIPESWPENENAPR